MPSPSAATAELDAQYRALREAAGALIRPSSAWLRVEGPDAAESLEGQVTNEVESLEPGQGRYAALLDRKGKMESDLRVLRLAPEVFLLEAEAEAMPRVGKHLRTYKLASAAEFTPLDDQATISVVGPASIRSLGLPPLGEHRVAPHSIGGHEGLAIGTPGGADFLCAAEHAEDVLARICETEAEAVEEAALEIIRVEEGIPRYGREMDEKTIPAEAGINDRAVSFTKGCYIGQETVARLHYKGKPNRHLRRLVLDSPVEDGDVISIPERDLGRIGTAVISPARGPLALAIVRREAKPGDRVQVGDSDAGAVVEEVGS